MSSNKQRKKNKKEKGRERKGRKKDSRVLPYGSTYNKLTKQ